MKKGKKKKGREEERERKENGKKVFEYVINK